DSGGARDAFEASALAQLSDGSSREYVRVEERNGRLELRYAQSVRMTESCVACHNSHPQSPKTDWEVGDIRGIQTVSVPIPDFLSSPTAGGDSAVFDHFAAVIAVLVGALALIGSLLFGLKLMVTRQERLLALLRQRNRKLAVAKTEAESASRMKTEFLATMSHELRTPLNAVIGFSEAMCSRMFGPIGSARYGEFAEHINASGQRLLGVINNIIDLSQIEAGQFDLRETEIDLAATIDRVLEMFADDANAASLVWTVEIETGLPAILGSERAVRQVLHNILTNAVNFTPAGGAITLLARRTSAGEIEIVIEDTGAGIAPEEITVAMSPFTQIDGGLDRQIDGIGLGLPLSKRFVEIHGGTFEIEQPETGGTRVVILFPPDRIVGRDATPVAA
ncbi:MAG: DUF3365 domain-containing protein, partial [Alphaproteobacteria bacterium]|nr:DUF3365 domain-containing protein [Alphaproteobacteria bacterium]